MVRLKATSSNIAGIIVTVGTVAYVFDVYDLWLENIAIVIFLHAPCVLLSEKGNVS